MVDYPLQKSRIRLQIAEQVLYLGEPLVVYEGDVIHGRPRGRETKSVSQLH